MTFSKFLFVFFQISIEVDGNQYSPHDINSDFSFVRPAPVFLGGSSNTNDITDAHISSNFYGRIREVGYCW